MMSFSTSDMNFHVLIIICISSVRQNESWLLRNITWSNFKAARERKQDAAHPAPDCDVELG